MSQPLVTVICLCYNHQRFVREAVESVVNQSYKNIQIIVADDASDDTSVTEIKRLKDEYPALELLLSSQNNGNCKAFNAALKLAKGDFVIDFATDDIMMPDRVQRQVDFFLIQHPVVGVVFTDAVYIDEEGINFRSHYAYLFKNKLLNHIPQGDVYRDVLATYFIASPTMMMRRNVLEELNGFDENLVYEDFDFWVRSARLFQYAFLNEQLTSIRRTNHSMSTGWYVPGDRQLHSTYLVCKKAQHLNRDEGDRQALIVRVRYEFRQSVFSENHIEANLFYELLTELQGNKSADFILHTINNLRLPLSPIRKWYHFLRYS